MGRYRFYVSVQPSEYSEETGPGTFSDSDPSRRRGANLRNCRPAGKEKVAIVPRNNNLMFEASANGA
jgi:hypothetical protein